MSKYNAVIVTQAHRLWHTIGLMQNTSEPSTNIHLDLTLAQRHYENFPVASVFLPSNLRTPIRLIYCFARQADDFSDEGDFTIAQRLQWLNNFREELDLLQADIPPKSDFFVALGRVIQQYHLPWEPFYNLLDAFSQDVVKTRYANEAEVMHYCTRSANPIGRLLLQLYNQATPQNILWSDQICTALQLINFLQDIAIDYEKNAGKQRIYLCQDEMTAFGVNEQQIGDRNNNVEWQRFMRFNLQRAHALLQAGKPLGRALTGRIGFEMRLIIAGGERIIEKLTKINGDVFRHRPTLNYMDWFLLFFRALFRQ